MSEWFKASRRKLCSHSDKYTFIRNGKTFSGTRCNPYTGPASAKQTTVRNKFKQAAQLRALILDDDNLKEQWRERFMADKAAKQTTATTLNGYIVQMSFLDHIASDGSYQS